jgi:hypothetical protein
MLSSIEKVTADDAAESSLIVYPGESVKEKLSSSLDPKNSSVSKLSHANSVMKSNTSLSCGLYSLHCCKITHTLRDLYNNHPPQFINLCEKLEILLEDPMKFRTFTASNQQHLRHLHLDGDNILVFSIRYCTPRPLTIEYIGPLTDLHTTKEQNHNKCVATQQQEQVLSSRDSWTVQSIHDEID